MSVLQITSLLIVLAGAFGAINYLFLRLPPAIGVLIVALDSSLVVLGLVGYGLAGQIFGAFRMSEFRSAIRRG